MLKNPALMAGSLLALACIGISACKDSAVGENRLEAVKRSGELVVLTRNSPTSYYEGSEGPTGFEYDLAHAFAQHLGVNLRIKTVEHFSELIPMIANGDADFAAAGITITPQREQQVRFTPPYQTIRQEVIYNGRMRPPKDIAELAQRHIEVASGTSYVERLEKLKEKYPKLTWTAIDNMETEELLVQVQEGLLDITIADSNIVAVSRQFNPDLRTAFALNEPENLAWAFPPSNDDSLYQEAVKFIEAERSSNEFSRLIERHYGAANRLNPINIAAFLQKIDSDLPRYKPLFIDAGRRNALDWRLLAALSYQESFWDPTAVSPTGVRGIMMLTEDTAEHLGIADRLDAYQSIHGGGAYLRDLHDRIPKRIPEPDRTWMALASYNVGINHVEDARVIVQTRGGDPDKWSDVQESLPLLTKAVWYVKTEHGYARGYEPVQFVNRIRSYYEVLKRKDEETRARNNNDALRLRAPTL